MTDLTKLTVSLTKHGAHKVAELLEKVDIDQVVKSTWDTVPGININAAQAKKTLSAQQSGVLPSFWLDAKQAGPHTIKSLVILGIIFSHHRLIEGMHAGITGRGTGIITRAMIDNGKGFTNFKDDFFSLGFSVSTRAWTHKL